VACEALHVIGIKAPKNKFSAAAASHEMIVELRVLLTEKHFTSVPGKLQPTGYAFSTLCGDERHNRNP
jgi:hypothetical protein